MVSVDFTKVYEDAFVRDYPEAAPGWVDGVYSRRQAMVAKVNADALSADGLVFKVRRLVEESEPLGSDANSIDVWPYWLGTFVELAAPSRRQRLTLKVKGVDAKDHVFRVIVNELPVAQFSLAVGQERELSFEMEPTKRGLELTFDTVDVLDDDTTDWASIAVSSIEYEDVEVAPAARPEIFLVADSTVQTYFDEEAPQAGWGEWLYWYLEKDHVASYDHDAGSKVMQARVFRGDGPVIHNRALGARSFKTYNDEGRFPKMLADLHPNDVVLIQFGINDAMASRPQRYASLSDFAVWLERYTDSILDRGARPVLMTTTPQYTEEHNKLFGPYSEVTRKFAADHNLPLIDLRQIASDYLATLPGNNKDAMFLRAPAFQYQRHMDGIADTVHLSPNGSKVYAGLVARELTKLYPEFAFYDVEPGEPEPVEELTASVLIDPIGTNGDVRWKPSRHANYYTIEKRNRHGRSYGTEIALEPRFYDKTLFGQSRHVTYVVTAWRDEVASEPRTVELELPVYENLAQDLG